MGLGLVYVVSKEQGARSRSNSMALGDLDLVDVDLLNFDKLI